jgi:hypothetical protein
VTGGRQITFYPTVNVSKLLACKSDSESRDPAPTSAFTYRFGTDPVNANRYLYLTSPNGPEWQYLRE